MSFDLLEAVKGLFTGDVVTQAANQLGESESGIQKAIGGIVPTVLTGLLHKAGSGTQDAASALNITKEASGAGTSGGGILGALQGNAGSLLGKGTELLKGLFGDKITAITGAIASYAGIKESSAGALLNAAAPAALGAVGQHAEQNNLSGAGFLAFLNSQKDKILAAVPAGLNLAGLLGLGSLTDLGKKLSGLVTGFAGNAAGKVSDVAAGATAKASSGRWLWSLLLILVAVILLWYLIKGCGGSKTTDTVTSDTAATSEQVDTAASEVSTPAAGTERESIQVSLPDGTVLNAYKGGIEDQLVNFLKDDSKKPGKDVWFDFDNLNFKTGSTEITEESQVQIQNIASILKAFPKSKIKIGGYTDRTGDSTANLKLSQSRAGAVEGALKKLNANTAQLLGAEGYGSQFAKAEATAPDEERKKDRHISISVREK